MENITNVTPTQALAVKASSKDDPRDQLRALNVEVKDGKKTATGTDGYRLMAITTDAKGEPDFNDSYDRDTVEIAQKIAKVTKSEFVGLDKPTTGQFPDWRKIKPDQAEYKTAKFQRKLLISLLQSMDADFITVGLGSEQQPMVVEGSQMEHDYYGLLMPLRS